MEEKIELRYARISDQRVSGRGTTSIEAPASSPP